MKEELTRAVKLTERTALAGLVFFSSILPDLAFYQRLQIPNIQQLIEHARSPLFVGFSFSIRQANYLHLDPHLTLENLLAMNFDYVRISTYLSDPTTQTLKDLNWQLELAEKYHTQAIVSVGLKSQNYPEFYPPAGKTLSSPDLEQTVLADMRKIFSIYGNDPRIKIWQIDNEPLNDFSDSGIPPVDINLVDKETALARKYTSKPILMTQFLDPDSNKPDRWKQLVDRADIVGQDVYSKINGQTVPADQLDRKAAQHIREASQQGKLSIFPEIQTNDWGQSHFSVKDLFNLFNNLVVIADPKSIFLLWDAEKAVWEQQGGDGTKINAFGQILEVRTTINSQT